MLKANETSEGQYPAGRAEVPPIRGLAMRTTSLDCMRKPSVQANKVPGSWCCLGAEGWWGLGWLGPNSHVKTVLEGRTQKRSGSRIRRST